MKKSLICAGLFFALLICAWGGNGSGGKIGNQGQITTWEEIDTKEQNATEGQENTGNLAKSQGAENVIAVELEDLAGAEGFTEDEGSDLNESENEKPLSPSSSAENASQTSGEDNSITNTSNSDTSNPAENSEVKVVHKSLEFVPDEILARPEVEKFRNQYLTEKWSKLLYIYLEQGMEYRLYVRKALQDQNLPAILEYLPVVESNYKTNAKSRSGAIGMWQFMANSVYPFLTLNDYVDERLDPWKSTDGALKKLTDNYNYFNDWFIAIAAYNCGVGAMSRILKKSPEKDFWYLVDHNLLPSQTANYVPKLIAIADLAMNSEYYGIDLPSHDQEFEELINEREGNFDYVEVNKAYSISQLAQEMRIDENSLKRLNPSFILGITHPSKKSQIRLPLGMKQTAQDALSKMKVIDFPVKYKVVAGDSLWSISRRYGVTVAAICELNNIKENAILKIGKVLYIPAK